MNYEELIVKGGFPDPYNTAITVHTRNFDFNLAFIEYETKGELCILVTDDKGREKLKILNKKYVEAIEIIYQDDISFEDKEEKKDRMFI